MKITVIGRGKIGGALAGRWEKAGHTVTRVGRDGGDAADADAILVAVPSGQIADALGRVAGIEGKIAIDAMNAFDGRAGNHESLTHEVKSIVGGPVAKVFNLQYSTNYDKIDAQRNRPSNLYASEDAARVVAEQLIRDAGFDPVPVGDIDKARLLEDCAPLFAAVRLAGGGPHFHRFAKPGQL